MGKIKAAGDNFDFVVSCKNHNHDYRKTPHEH